MLFSGNIRQEVILEEEVNGIVFLTARGR